MLKRCRLILLDEKVANPRCSVAGDQSQRKEPPFASDDKVNGAAERDGGANEVQQTRLGTAVFPHVVGPEFGE